MPDEREVYKNVNVKVGAFHLPSLALAILGAIAKKNGYRPTILDMGIEDRPEDALKKCLSRKNPKYIAITCTSATYYQAIEIATVAKTLQPDITVLVGGTHVSSLVSESLRVNNFDYVFVGEADYSFAQFLQGVDPKNIEGIAFRGANGEICFTPNKSFIMNLENFVFPDYTLYDLTKYELSPLHSKNNPVVWLETSRGCPFNCQICNKVVHGQTFRAKSAQRVIDEIKYLLSIGIKEFHIADDGFSSDMNRAEQICDMIIENKLDFSWACVNGIRVDRVNKSLLRKMKQAGCYRISFGIESGNQSVLDHLGKRVTLEQIRNSVKLAKSVGLEVFGFFIFGFEDDTAETMMDTIRFAKSLPLDLAKASIMMPFPGSPLYHKYMGMDLLFPTEQYRNFNAYIPPQLVYKHPHLEWPLVEKYQEKFYRSFYFNPPYLFRRLMHAIKNGTLLSDIRVALKMEWFRKESFK